MKKNTGKVREFCQRKKVGTLIVAFLNMNSNVQPSMILLHCYFFTIYCVLQFCVVRTCRKTNFHGSQIVTKVMLNSEKYLLSKTFLKIY